MEPSTGPDGLRDWERVRSARITVHRPRGGGLWVSLAAATCNGAPHLDLAGVRDPPAGRHRRRASMAASLSLRSRGSRSRAQHGRGARRSTCRGEGPWTASRSSPRVARSSRGARQRSLGCEAARSPQRRWRARRRAACVPRSSCQSSRRRGRWACVLGSLGAGARVLGSTRAPRRSRGASALLAAPSALRARMRMES